MAHNNNNCNKAKLSSSSTNILCSTSNHQCKCQPNISTSQTLNEMEFERGIWSAALYNDLSQLKKFILKGNVNDRDLYGYTALHYAARNGNLDACKLLINSGADINIKTNGGVTPLHRASMMGHENIVQLLIEHRVNVNIQDDDGETALHRAVLKLDTSNNNNYLKIIQLLLNCDKNLKTICNKKGQKPVDIIIEHNKFPHLIITLS